jgi:hypothetical protein
LGLLFEAGVMRFDTFVVRDDCINDLETVRSHANVRHVTRLPCDWVLYEFHHDLFKDPDFLKEGIWQEKMQHFPKLREARVDMLNQERALLAPWYAKKKKLGDADALLASEVCPYRMSSLTSMRWIDLVPVAGWGSANIVTITLAAADATPSAALSKLAEEWAACGKDTGELDVASSLVVRAGSFMLKARCKYYSGHWIAGLWALLSDARWTTGVRKMNIALS